MKYVGVIQLLLLAASVSAFQLPNEVIIPSDTKDHSDQRSISEIVENLQAIHDYRIIEGGKNLENINFDQGHNEGSDGESWSMIEAVRGMLSNRKDDRDLGSNKKCIESRQWKYYSQRFVMREIFDQTGVTPLRYQDASVFFGGTKEKFDECDWLGVHCESGKIKRILLKDAGIVRVGDGFFPPEQIALLEDLEVLDLSENQALFGTIPPELAELDELRVIDISETGLGGDFICSKHGQSRIISYGQGDDVLDPELAELFTPPPTNCLCSKDVCFDNGKGITVDAQSSGDIDTIVVDDIIDVIDDNTVVVGSVGGNRRMNDKTCVDRFLWYRVSQRYALEELFYNTAIVPNAPNATGATSPYMGIDALYTNNECEWLGVTCNDGLVTRINLQNEGLSSKRAFNTKENMDLYEVDSEDILPDSMQYLVHLELLDLSRNKLLVGNIPECFDELEELRFLDVSSTQIRGKVPCNNGGKAKVVSWGGTAVKIGEGAFQNQGGFVTNPTGADDFLDGYQEGRTRFGIECSCHRDVCLFKDSDIRVKPYDR